jgi:translation initiation factor 2 alpha subunit (eIF-2alpha)
MKLNTFTNPNTKPDDNLLYNFMCLTLWEIQTEFENEYILEKLLSKDTNNEILESIDYESLGISIEKIKQILDDYIGEKINRIKPELTETIKLMTYSSDGLANIKYTLDWKNYPFAKELEKDFEIKILYMSSSVYSLNIKQYEFDLIGNIQIDDALQMIKKEIKTRAIEKSIQNQIV